MPDSKAIKERNLLDGGTEGIRWGDRGGGGGGGPVVPRQGRNWLGAARRGSDRGVYERQ